MGCGSLGKEHGTNWDPLVAYNQGVCVRFQITTRFPPRWKRCWKITPRGEVVGSQKRNLLALPLYLTVAERYTEPLRNHSRLSIVLPLYLVTVNSEICWKGKPLGRVEVYIHSTPIKQNGYKLPALIIEQNGSSLGSSQNCLSTFGGLRLVLVLQISLLPVPLTTDSLAPAGLA